MVTGNGSGAASCPTCRLSDAAKLQQTGDVLKSGGRVSRSDGSSVFVVSPPLKALLLFMSHQLGEKEAPDQAGRPGSFFCSGQ